MPGLLSEAGGGGQPASGGTALFQIDVPEMRGSTLDEMFRATLQTRTPEGARAAR